MKKVYNIDDFKELKKAKKKIKELEILIQDLDKAEDLMYNHFSEAPIWDLLQRMSEIKIVYYFEYQGWKDALEQGKEND